MGLAEYQAFKVACTLESHEHKPSCHHVDPKTHVNELIKNIYWYSKQNALTVAHAFRTPILIDVQQCHQEEIAHAWDDNNLTILRPMTPPLVTLTLSKFDWIVKTCVQKTREPHRCFSLLPLLLLLRGPSSSWQHGLAMALARFLPSSCLILSRVSHQLLHMKKIGGIIIAIIITNSDKFVHTQ